MRFYRRAGDPGSYFYFSKSLIVYPSNSALYNVKPYNATFYLLQTGLQFWNGAVTRP